jgi:hypothetical protein
VSRKPGHYLGADRPTPPRRVGLLFLSSVLCPLLFSSGCSNKKYDLIEAELRTRERELAEARAALEQAKNLNRAYVQQSPSAAGNPAAAGPGGSHAIPVKEIVLARGTGGVDEDGVPGDEGLMVVVAPKDDDGSPVKVPGQVQVAAWEVLPSGIKNPIGNWTVPAEKVRPTWRSGFISTGYFVALPWQTYPSTERVRIAVRLATTDGRAFETDKDISVKLVQTPRINPPGGPIVPPVVPPVGPGFPGREPIFPDPLPPPGNNLPPGVEELPPPGGRSSTSERGARLLPPVKQ